MFTRYRGAPRDHSRADAMRIRYYATRDIDYAALCTARCHYHGVCATRASAVYHMRCFDAARVICCAHVYSACHTRTRFFCYGCLEGYYIRYAMMLSPLFFVTLYFIYVLRVLRGAARQQRARAAVVEAPFARRQMILILFATDIFAADAMMTPLLRHA